MLCVLDLPPSHAFSLPCLLRGSIATREFAALLLTTSHPSINHHHPVCVCVRICMAHRRDLFPAVPIASSSSSRTRTRNGTGSGRRTAGQASTSEGSESGFANTRARQIDQVLELLSDTSTDEDEILTGGWVRRAAGFGSGRTGTRRNIRADAHVEGYGEREGQEHTRRGDTGAASTARAGHLEGRPRGQWDSPAPSRGGDPRGQGNGHSLFRRSLAIADQEWATRSSSPPLHPAGAVEEALELEGAQAFSSAGAAHPPGSPGLREQLGLPARRSQHQQLHLGRTAGRDKDRGMYAGSPRGVVTAAAISDDGSSDATETAQTRAPRTLAGSNIYGVNAGAAPSHLHGANATAAPSTSFAFRAFPEGNARPDVDAWVRTSANGSTTSARASRPPSSSRVPVHTQEHGYTYGPAEPVHFSSASSATPQHEDRLRPQARRCNLHHRRGCRHLRCQAKSSRGLSSAADDEPTHLGTSGDAERGARPFSYSGGGGGGGETSEQAQMLATTLLRAARSGAEPHTLVRLAEELAHVGSGTEARGSLAGSVASASSSRTPRRISRRRAPMRAPHDDVPMGLDQPDSAVSYDEREDHRSRDPAQHTHRSFGNDAATSETASQSLYDGGPEPPSSLPAPLIPLPPTPPDSALNSSHGPGPGRAFPSSRPQSYGGGQGHMHRWRTGADSDQPHANAERVAPPPRNAQAWQCRTDGRSSPVPPPPAAATAVGTDSLNEALAAARDEVERLAQGCARLRRGVELLRRGAGWVAGAGAGAGTSGSAAEAVFDTEESELDIRNEAAFIPNGPSGPSMMNGVQHGHDQTSEPNTNRKRRRPRTHSARTDGSDNQGTSGAQPTFGWRESISPSQFRPPPATASALEIHRHDQGDAEAGAEAQDSDSDFEIETQQGARGTRGGSIRTATRSDRQPEADDRVWRSEVERQLAEIVGRLDELRYVPVFLFPILPVALMAEPS